MTTKSFKQMECVTSTQERFPRPRTQKLATMLIYFQPHLPMLNPSFRAFPGNLAGVTLQYGAAKTSANRVRRADVAPAWR